MSFGGHDCCKFYYPRSERCNEIHPYTSLLLLKSADKKAHTKFGTKWGGGGEMLPVGVAGLMPLPLSSASEANFKSYFPSAPIRYELDPPWSHVTSIQPGHRNHQPSLANSINIQCYYLQYFTSCREGYLKVEWEGRYLQVLQ